MGIKPHRRCQVCKHAERWRIELLRAGGSSLDALATKFNVDRDAIWRHWQNHVTPEMKAGYLVGPAALQQLAEKSAAEGDSVIDHLRMVRTVLTGQLAAMTESGDGRGAAYVAGRLVSTLEAMARITGELGDLARSTINFNGNVSILSPSQVAKLEATILRALAPHPLARADVVIALRDMDGEGAVMPAGALANGSAARLIEHV